jgi:hypothetical protein
VAEALKAGVSTFADVMKQPGYVNNTPELQGQIANDFFNERVATQDGYVNNTPELQSQIKKDFQSPLRTGWEISLVIYSAVFPSLSRGYPKCRDRLRNPLVMLINRNSKHLY